MMVKTGKFEHIDGIDLSEDAILIATKKNRKYIDNGVVSIKHASVSELPFEDDHFDAITAFQSHFHWPDILEAMQDIHRVLKTGGQFVLVAEIYKIEYHMKEFNSVEKTKELFLLSNFKDVTQSTSQKSICVCGYK
jgi:Methylase involved in ubiquinone/menaquinone biosynthesis